MINSILTIVNNITTYATNNSDVFKLALALTILGAIIFCGSDDDIHSILVAFILVFVGASLMIFYFL